MGAWSRTISGVVEVLDSYSPDQQNLPEVTRKLTELLKADHAYPADREFTSVIEDLEIFQGEHDEPYFNLILQALYDWADRVRVWIEPIPVRH